MTHSNNLAMCTSSTLPHRTCLLSRKGTLFAVHAWGTPSGRAHVSWATTPLLVCGLSHDLLGGYLASSPLGMMNQPARALRSPSRPYDHRFIPERDCSLAASAAPADRAPAASRCPLATPPPPRRGRVLGAPRLGHHGGRQEFDPRLLLVLQGQVPGRGAGGGRHRVAGTAGKAVVRSG